MAAELPQRIQQLARHLAHRAVGGERHAVPATVAVLGDRDVGAQVQRHDQGARPVRGRQGSGLPAPGGQPQRRVLELWLRRREPDGELAEHLRVGVQRVAGGGPAVIGERGPGVGHMGKLPATGRALSISSGGGRSGGGRADNVSLANGPRRREICG